MSDIVEKYPGGTPGVPSHSEANNVKRWKIMFWEGSYQGTQGGRSGYSHYFLWYHIIENNPTL